MGSRRDCDYNPVIMFRATLALMMRSLRQDSRTIKPALARFALLSFTLMSLWLSQAIGGVFGAPGLYFFMQISSLNFLAVCLAATGYFSACITEEKEERTLGLLKMAGVSPVALLLGKSVPRVVMAMLLLTVQFPFTLLAITMGGVSLSQMLAMYLALLAWTVLLAALGLFWSVVCFQGAAAARCTTLTLLAFLFGPFVCSQLLQTLLARGEIVSDGTVHLWCEYLLGKWREVSMWYRLRTILATGFGESPFSLQIWFCLAGAVVLFSAAWLLFEPCTAVDVPATARAKSGASRRWFSLRPGRVWWNAFVWKDFNFVTGGRKFFLARLIGYPLAIVLLVCLYRVFNRRFPNTNETAGFMRGAMWVALIVEPMMYVSRLFADEIKEKNLGRPGDASAVASRDRVSQNCGLPAGPDSGRDRAGQQHAAGMA